MGIHPDVVRAAAFALLAVLAVMPAAAQLGLPDPVVLEGALDERVWIADGWRYHPGDAPAWAAPGFDDSAWPVVASTMRDPETMPGGWPGIGWFRRRIVLGEGMPATALGLRAEHYGASEIYLDGRLVARFGTVAATAEAERPVYPNDFVGVALEPGTVHVLAVRYSNAKGNVYAGWAHGFQINIRSVESAGRAYHRWTMMITGWQIGFGGAFAALALLHLLLFAFRPRGRENLAVAAYTGLLATELMITIPLRLTTDVAGRLALFKPAHTIMVVTVLVGLGIEHLLLRRRPSAFAWVVGAGGLLLAGWVWSWSEFRSSNPYGTAFLLAAFGEMLRVALAAVSRRVPDAWIVAVGFVPIAAIAVFQGAWDLVGLDRMIEIPAPVALLPIALAFSVFLSRRTARTSRQLEVKLAEVGELSARAIEQERRVAEQEAERRLLEAESRRRSEELEVARRLQVAMLPRTLPEIEGFDLAFRMVTATEVGGDYVDVRSPGRDGTLLAVGDATSHGLHAGMVVGVAKSLFQSAAPDDDPVQVLHRIGSGLDAMDERHASMAMAVLRLQRRRLTLSSAGMPPVLVLHGSSRAVDEVLLPGVPLGTLSAAIYQQREVELENGDVVVVMTDGLVEALDEQGRMFGYERTAAELAKLAGRPAAEVVGALLDAVNAHLGGATPPDDVTLVALVVR